MPSSRFPCTVLARRFDFRLRFLDPKCSQQRSITKIAEVGRLEVPRTDTDYRTGQLILHRVFGYRAVILFPWHARVYDRSLNQTHCNDYDDRQQQQPQQLSNRNDDLDEPLVSLNPFHNSTTRTNTFYQVLIDQRDCPFIRAQTEAVTFLGSQECSRNLYAIPGLDYVAHEDAVPYTSDDQMPIYHELFDKFLARKSTDSTADDTTRNRAVINEPGFEATKTLVSWQTKNYPWLELSDVHKETTENVRITVTPFYMGCRQTQTQSTYWWRYCVRIENVGSLNVQLRERHWRIFSLTGTLETVRGRGVVGQEPILSYQSPAFQYSSHVSLHAPSGHMWGTFRVEREDGYTFDCRIPPFSLESKPNDYKPSYKISSFLSRSTQTKESGSGSGGGGGGGEESNESNNDNNTINWTSNHNNGNSNNNSNNNNNDDTK